MNKGEKLSIYDLAYEFICMFYTSEPAKQEKVRVLHLIREMLINKWASDEMLTYFKHIKLQKEIQEVKDVVEYINAKALRYPKKKINLLGDQYKEGDPFYYHNQLRITSPPPKRYFDYNTGEIVKIEEPYFLEMRASYTIEDLCEYYIKQMGLKDIHPQDENRFAKAFLYVLKKYDLETVLFMVDAMVNEVLSEGLNKEKHNPLKIVEWKDVALMHYNEKVTESAVYGENKVVPRKRILLF